MNASKLRYLRILAVVAIVLVGGTTAAVSAPSHWEKDIAAFVEQDRAHPPVQGGVLFIGSSSIRMWKSLEKDFPGVPIINRGFGGSGVADSTFYFDQLVMPSKPRLIVFFAGTNDVNGGANAERVAENFRAFCAKVHTELPQTRVIFISLAIVESRWAQRATVALPTTYVAAYCASDSRMTFLDTNAVMLTPEGKVRPEYYRADKLHMTEAGYAEWTKLLQPLVK